MKRKYMKVLCAVLLIFLAFILIITVVENVSIRATDIFTKTGGCISVSLDKKKMKSVNRIVISEGEGHKEIVDPILIRSLVRETLAATHTGTGCPYERKIDLYSDETLIRTMYWSSCCDSIYVYDAAPNHWIVSIEGIESKGFIYLSDLLAKELNKLFED